MTFNEIAVVFVHGIGTQTKSSTLTAWGEPLTEAFDRRVGDADVYVEQATLALGEAPEVTVVVPQHTDTDGHEWNATRIHMTEAWWADAFLVQHASTVMGWGLRFLLRAALRITAHLLRLVYAGGRWQAVVWWNEWSARLRAPRVRMVLEGVLFIAYVVGVVLAIPLIVVATAFAFPAIAAIAALAIVVALAIFAGTRVPGLSKYLRPLATGLVATVGDASVWTSQPLSAAAMRTVVLQAVSRARIAPDGSHRKVVVVAHSQGAAITVDALFGGGPALGGRPLAGLTPISPTPLTRCEHDDQDQSITGLTVEGAPAIKPRLTLNEIWHVNATDQRPELLVTVGNATTLLRNVRAVRKRKHGATWNPIEQWKASNTRWINVWALWDPVPSGPMGLGREGSDQRRFAACQSSGIQFSQRCAQLASGMREPRAGLESAARSFANKAGDEAGPEEWPVYNTALMLTDHTTYTANTVQVIEPLCTEILRTAAGQHDRQPTSTTGSDATTLRRVDRHITGVRRLAMVRILALLTIVVSLPVTSRIPGVNDLQAAADSKIRAAGKDDTEPAHLILAAWEWLGRVCGGLTLGGAALAATYAVLCYLAITALFKALARFSDDRNVAPDWPDRWKDWPAQLGLVGMLALAVGVFAGLRASPVYSSLIEGSAKWVHASPQLAWAAVALALFTLVQQGQRGNRLYRTPAVTDRTHSSSTDSDSNTPTPVAGISHHAIPNVETGT